MKNNIFEGFQFLENKSFSNNIDLEKKHDNNKYINIKEETNNENEKEIKQNNLIINLKNKEKLSPSHPDFHHVKFDDLINKYTIVDMPKKDFIIYKCYQYITNLNDNDKNKISKKNEIILNENIKLIIKKLSPVFILQINGEEIVINKEARKICFIDQVKQIKYIRFIFSADCLYNVLDELKFNYYYVKPQENNNINYEEKSINSECSVNNHFFIFSKEYITEIMKDNLKPIFSENNLLSLKKDEITFLKDLSNNFQYYNDEKKENKFIELDEYNQLFNQIKESIYSNNTKIIYIFGPKGVSKTIFLLYFRNFILFENIHSLYFDYNYLKNQRDYFQIKKILQYELLYSFLNFEEMCLFEKQKIFYHLEQEKNILSYIHKFLKKFLELKVPQKGKKFIIIIDNIHLPKEYSEEELYLKKIIALNDSGYDSIKIILSGSGPFFNNKFCIFCKNLNIQRFSYPESGFYLTINEKNLNSLNFFENNKIYKNMNEFFEKKISQEEEYLEKYQFFSLFYCEELVDDKFSENILNESDKILIYGPFEYFIIENLGSTNLRFKFFSPIYKRAIRRKIGIKVELGALNILLRDKTFPRTGYGIIFEKIITLLLSHNRINLLNLQFTKNNKKEIENISDLEMKHYQNPELKVENNNQAILITQSNYRGQNYDLLILSKIEGIHYSDFVQIGVNKTASEIKSILQNIKDKEEVIINNIKNNFQIENVRVSLLFIFDLKTQIKVNYKAVCDCLKNNINYYLFSSEEQCFYRHNFINKMNEKIFTYTPYLSNDLNLNSFLNKKRSTRTRKTKKRNY